MAIYHCHCKVISRGQGRSAVGAAAYRSGEKLTNDYDGLTHDYTSKGGVVYSEIILCENAPQEYQNRAILWNEVERIEKGQTAQLAREYEIALPVELNREEQIQLVRDYVKDNFVSRGMCADIAIHDKEDGNPHAHILLTMRPIEPDGRWGAKAINEYVLDKNGERILQKIDKQNRKIYKRVKTDTTDWNTKDFLHKSREAWALSINHALEKKNLPQRVDHRSFEAQGKAQIPTEHIGVSAKAMERRGRKSERGERNREIKRANEQVQAINNQIKQIQREIAYIREDVRWNSQHEQIQKIQAYIPQIETNERLLHNVQSQLEKIYVKAQGMKPSKASEGRTVEYDLRQIPYFDYHKGKLIADIADLQEQVGRRLAILEEQRAEPQAQGAVKEKIQGSISEPPQRQPVPPSIDVSGTARQLAEYRAAYIRATIQAQSRTSYQENPIYRQQAVQIADLARRVQEQTASIKQLQAEKDTLGMFKGKEKKALQGKIDNFMQLRQGNLDKLGALGVKDPARADEAIKEKTALAAAEQAKAKAARENVGAAERAEEAKAAFLSLARSIPPELRQEVAAELERQEPTDSGQSRLAYFKAEAEARRQLDPALKPEPGHQRGQSRTRWNEPER